MEVIFQLAAIIAVVTVGPVVIILLAARKGNLLFFYEYLGQPNFCSPVYCTTHGSTSCAARYRTIQIK